MNWNEETYVEIPFCQELSKLGWSIITLNTHQTPADSQRETFRQVIIEPELRQALSTINPFLEDDQITELVTRLQSFNSSPLGMPDDSTFLFRSPIRFQPFNDLPDRPELLIPRYDLDTLPLVVLLEYGECLKKVKKMGWFEHPVDEDLLTVRVSSVRIYGGDCYRVRVFPFEIVFSFPSDGSEFRQVSDGDN